MTYLSDMHCSRHLQCEDKKEKCQNGLCVCRSGGHCRHHIHCPQLEVCLQNKCQQQKCEKYKDCSKIHHSLMCHPAGLCSGNVGHMSMASHFGLYYNMASSIHVVTQFRINFYSQNIACKLMLAWRHTIGEVWHGSFWYTDIALIFFRSTWRCNRWCLYAKSHRELWKERTFDET